MWHGTKFNASNMRVFGCDAWATLSEEQQKARGKMAPKAVITTMVGYSTKSDAYRLLNFKTGNFIETKHVIFQEEKINSGMDKIDTSQDVDQMNMLDEERDTPREDQNDEDYILTSVEAKKTQGNAENENVALRAKKERAKRNQKTK